MKDISDRSSWGAEWEPVSGLKFRLFNRKGTTRLDFQIVRWGRNMVDDGVEAPSRFGLDTPPESYDEFVFIACEYAQQVEVNTERAKKHTVIYKAGGGTRRPDEDTPPQRLFMRIF